LSTLYSILEMAYYASLGTEEGKPVVFDMVYLDPSSPDPKPPPRLPADRWSFVPLQAPIPVTVLNLSKLARATDPRSSSLVVYPDKRGTPTIWGLIDQGTRYYDFLNFDSEEGPERPGLFQLSVAGLGRLIAYLGYAKIAELRINSLITRTSDVLRKGPIRRALQTGISKYVASVKSSLSSAAYNERGDWRATLEDDWVATLCRLLLRTRAYRHGGAFLITSDETETGLDVKYRIRYPRLASALHRRGVLLVQRTYAEDHIIADFFEKDRDFISADRYLDREVAKNELEETNDEINGAVWLVSLLSRVDGLVLMDPNLCIRGFGVEITYDQDLDAVYRAATPNARPSRLRKLDYKHFGTRHRSMMRYVAAIQPSVGFVVSQDGDVRAITRLDDKVVLWENIRLQIDDFVKREKTTQTLLIDRDA
jgi:hypothetical protein